jgi:hypothetical protein
MATLTLEHMQDILNRAEKNDLTEALNPIVKKYFPGGFMVKPHLLNEGHGDESYLLLTDITVYDKNMLEVIPTDNAYTSDLAHFDPPLTITSDDMIRLEHQVLSPIAIDDNTFEGLFPKTAPTHVTSIGNFTGHISAENIIAQMDDEDVEDVLTNNTASNTLNFVDMNVAYAILDQDGLTTALSDIDEHEHSLLDYLCQFNNLQDLAVHLTKLALVKAAEEI